jgi:ribonuclease III
MPPVDRKSIFRDFMLSLGADPAGLALFNTALTHGSSLNEALAESLDGELPQANERMEFLGDAVLGLVIADRLYAQARGWQEGQLSKAKARLVSAEVLARHARSLNLGALLQMGRGEVLSGGRNRDSILADALEALLGAWFLAEGLDKVRAFILKLWAEDLNQEQKRPGECDAKSQLQEWSQRLKQVLPEYRVAAVRGPDHNRVYEVSVFLDGREYGQGNGRSKKEAEQAAAAQALEKCRQEAG